MDKKTMKKVLKGLIPKMEKVESTFHADAYKSIFLGSYLSLDPCGKYHHFLSPNGVTKKCENYWQRLEKAADKLVAGFQVEKVTHWTYFSVCQ